MFTQSMQIEQSFRDLKPCRFGQAFEDSQTRSTHKSLQENIPDVGLRAEVEAKIAAFAEHMRNLD
ncbi:MAG: hypothetical protein WAV67_02335 [Dokdonella sp.]